MNGDRTIVGKHPSSGPHRSRSIRKCRQALHRCSDSSNTETGSGESLLLESLPPPIQSHVPTESTNSHIIHSFIPDIYVAHLQETYSEAVDQIHQSG